MKSYYVCTHCFSELFFENNLYKCKNCRAQATPSRVKYLPKAKTEKDTLIFKIKYLDVKLKTTESRLSFYEEKYEKVRSLMKELVT